MATNKYHTIIRQEGEAGAIRGKISAGMAAQMGAGDGDVIEWTVTGKTCTGAKVLRGKDARDFIKHNARGASAPVKAKSPAKAKVAAGKSSKLQKSKLKGKSLGKLAKPKAKGSKRLTKVEYDVPKKTAKLGKKFRLKGKK